jgi:hypothetical protein
MDRPGDVAELLEFLVRELDDDYESGTGRVPLPALLRLDGVDVATAAGGVDLHAKPLDGHPVDVLTGFTAPPEWFGIGVAVTGWSHEDGRRDRARITTLICRDGNEIGGLRVTGQALRIIHDHGVGPVPDTLRRVLGLPTPAPDVTLVEWMAKCWLEIVIRRAKRGKRTAKLTWREAAVLHPAIDTVGAEAEDLPDVAPALAANMRWERFRQLHAADDADAAWMDEGMFASWMVHGRPPLSVLLRRASKRLTPNAVCNVEATLAAWGLIDAVAA